MMYATQPAPTVDQSVLVKNVYFYSTDDKRNRVVLTPTCDFAQGKVEYVQICALVEASVFIKNLRKTDWQRSNGKDLQNKIKDLAKQKYPRYHWLNPPPNLTEPFIVDFQNIATLPIAEVEQLEIIAYLASPFREQLPARYSAYMSRIGTPDQSENDLIRWGTSYSA